MVRKSDWMSKKHKRKFQQKNVMLVLLHYEVECAKQTIFLLVLARNQTKAWARDLQRDRKWVREREKELDKGTQREGSAKGDAEWQSTPDSRRDQSAWDGSKSSEGRPVKMSQHSSWLVEILQNSYTSAIVYRCTRNAECHNLTFLS